MQLCDNYYLGGKAHYYLPKVKRSFLKLPAVERKPGRDLLQLRAYLSR